MNRANSLHGGLISTLIGSVGSLAVASNGWYNTGISTDIHATFVKPGGGDGDTVRVTGEIISMGTCGSSNPDPRQDARVHTCGVASPRDWQDPWYVHATT